MKFFDLTFEEHPFDQEITELAVHMPDEVRKLSFLSEWMKRGHVTFAKEMVP